MRPKGFYWVMLVGQEKWRGAEFDGTDWFLTGDEDPHKEEEFSKITAPIPEPWTGFVPVEN